MGNRLGKYTQDNTKCMVKIHGTTLAERALDALAEAGITKCIVVAGYKKENLTAFLGTQYKNIHIEYVYNDIYNKTNNIYSLYLAKDYLAADDTILLESDLIFENSLIRDIAAFPAPVAAAVAKWEAWMDGTVVRLAGDGVIAAFVPKKLFNFNEKDAYYKTVNIYKFSKEFSATTYIPFLESYMKSMGTNEYYEQVLRVIASLDTCELKAFVLGGQKWYEIDDAQDKDIAETIFAQNAPAKLELVARRYGGYWRFPAMLDYCYLVNPYFPPPRLCSEMKSCFETLLAGYPSGLSVQNMLAAKMFNVDEETMLAGNGAAELIRALSGAVSGKVCIIQPTFNEYAESFQKNQRIQIIYKTVKNMVYTKDDVLQWSEESDVIVLINPDNPSGNYIAQNDVLEIASFCAGQGKMLILDESFIDFAAGQDTHSLIEQPVLDAYPNLVLIKSLSKSYGIPGLRLGVLACGNRGFIADIRKNLPIWNINSFAEYFLQIIGKYKTEYRESCVKIAAERERLCAELEKTGLFNVYPSQANYLLCEIKTGHSAAPLAAFLLINHDIFIKDLTGKAGIPAGASYIRLAVRGSEDNDRLLRALSDFVLCIASYPPPPV